MSALDKLKGIQVKDPQTGKLKSWVIIVSIGIAVLALIALMRRGGGVVSGGQSSELTGGLNDLTNGIIGLGNIPTGGSGGSGGGGGNGGGGSGDDNGGGDNDNGGGDDSGGDGGGDDSGGGDNGGGGGGGGGTNPPPVTPPPDARTNLGQLISAAVHAFQADNAAPRTGGIGQGIADTVHEVQQAYWAGTSNIHPSVGSLPHLNPTNPQSVTIEAGDTSNKLEQAKDETTKSIPSPATPNTTQLNY